MLIWLTCRAGQLARAWAARQVAPGTRAGADCHAAKVAGIQAGATSMIQASSPPTPKDTVQPARIQLPKYVDGGKKAKSVPTIDTTRSHSTADCTHLVKITDY